MTTETPTNQTATEEDAERPTVERLVMYPLKALNPFIWLWNLFKYTSHLEMYRNKKYEAYDFSNDTKYF